MFLLGFVMWGMSWMQVSMWAIFAARISYKTRMIYFTKCLEKDAAFYDVNSPTEMSAKISKEISAIQRGLGEKVGNIIMSIFMFIFGFGLAFVWGWLLSVILMGAIPFIMLTGIGMAMSLETGLTA
jgi:ATP-binding cassette subfamily B (MDR/TAP) protein 1